MKKKLSLIYGYSESLKSHDIFNLAIINYKKTFNDFDTILHCWDNEPFLDEYIRELNPIEVIISKQPDIKKYDSRIYTCYAAGNYDKYSIIPRTFALQKLGNSLKKFNQYDICCIRRFDLFLYKHLANIDINKLNLPKDFVYRGNSYIPTTSDMIYGWGIERVNDYLLISNYNNMVQFLSFNIDDVMRYCIEVYNNIGKSNLKKDFHYFIAQRIKDSFSFSSINYFMNNPQDIQVAKHYYYDKGGTGIMNNPAKFKQLTIEINKAFEAL